MKKTLVLFLALVMLISLASAALAADSVKITIWDIDDPNALPEGKTVDDLYYYSIVRKYMELYPDVEVEYISLPENNDEANQKLLLAAASDTLPDVFRTVYSQPMAYDPSVLTDITAYVEGDPEWKACYKTGALETFYDVFNGHLYGVPMKMEGQGFYYNRALLDSLGLEVPDKMNWDQWVAILTALKDAGVMPLAQGANGSNWSCWGYYAMFANLGMLDELDSLLDGSLKFSDSVAFRGVYEHVTQLAELGLYAENITTLSYDMVMESFKAGEAGFISTGTWTIGDMEKAERAEDFGWTWGPLFDNGNQYGVKTFAWGLFAGRSASESEEKLQAVLNYMKLYAQPESAGLMLDTLGEVPAVYDRGTAANVSPLKSMMLEAMADDYWACNQTVDYFGATVYSSFWDAITGCMTGYVDVDEALDMMDEWYEINHE